MLDPLEGVGPLRFGMSPEQVSAALDGEAPAESHGYCRSTVGSPWEEPDTPEAWHVSRERYDRAGISVHYLYGNGSRPARVSVHGRTGPQVLFDGIELIGRKPTAVEADIVGYIENRDMILRVGCDGDLSPGSSQVWTRAERVGDDTISAACFCIEGREYHS
ncbi:hypothetical protein ACGFX4_15870 [Kitasatospora sp. NPDC048365]|uniref:hypothetical protein n=1 Tax=Kitasatospora sp. NPDC048365 TaxID=3364050 RepID=UPI00371ABDF8